MKATSVKADTENWYRDKPTIVGVRFVGDDGYFGKKTYRYFASRMFPINVGSWIKVKVGDNIKSVYVVSIDDDGAVSEMPLKMIYGYHLDYENDDLKAYHAKAITQLKYTQAIDDSLMKSMAFGASLHSQIDAMATDAKYKIKYKHHTFMVDKDCLTGSNFPTSNEVAELLQPQLKENIMHPFKLITKTFVTSDEVGQDVDVTTLSDDEIFELIAKAEAEITKLEAIKTKPKKLQQRINDLQAGITEITAYLDAKA